MARGRLTERGVSVAVAVVLLLGVGGFLARRAADHRRVENDVTAAELTGRSDASTNRRAGEAGPGGSPTGRAHERRNPAPTMTLAFGGDVDLQGRAIDGFGADGLSLLAGVRTLIERPDFMMINLDTAVSGAGPPPAGGHAATSGRPAASFGVLKATGVDAVTMANRHGLDFGRASMTDAIDAGRLANLPVVGVGRNEADAFSPYRTLVNGRRLAVLAATQVFDDGHADAWKARPDPGSGPAGSGTPTPATAGMAYADEPSRLVAAVRRVRPTADLLVVYLTWGDEGSECPNAAQQELARQLIAAGADVVVGSGANRVQSTGHLVVGGRQGFVAYGLGNLVTSNRDPATSSGAILELTVSGRSVIGAGVVPVRLVAGRPVPVDLKTADRAPPVTGASQGCSGRSR